MKRPMKKLAALAGGGALALLLTLCLPFTAQAAELSDGVNVINKGAVGKTYNIEAGQAVMIANQEEEADGQPIVFEGCTFNLSGETVKISGTQKESDTHDISYINGEVVTKLWVSGDVEFRNCAFVTAEGAGKSSTAGYDAAVYFYSGNINLYGCELTAEGYNGQFLGTYGSAGAVTFDDCDISTVNNKNGWSYAMYGGSVLKLVNGSTMTATGSTTDSGNINCFYSGDNKTGYDAIFVEDSTIDFSDNKAGGFAINNVNIYVKNSDITVNNNLGNACNSGNWFVENNSSIVMNGNRGGHALSCIGFDMTDSKLEILHNGYAGVYMQSRDSSFTNCTVDIACNGENLLSYSAGDLWLQGHKLTVTNCTSETQPGSAWLGGVGRTGGVEVASGSIVAYDLNSNAVDNLKSNTAPVLSSEDIALSAEEDKHTLFLNPFMKSDYARGNAEKTASNNDADLFKDDNVTDRSDIIGATKAKIGTLTEAQLSHHRYDWANGEITDQATEDTYGVTRYACTLACDDYLGATAEHPNSFDCEGTYVYAPLVGVTFDDNVDDDSVSGMPGDQAEITYEGTALEPETDPVRTSDDPEHAWIFTGWYTDPDCTEPFDFNTELTSNWTVLYAGWLESGIARIEPADITIYMGGDQGYEGVINGENGSYVSENSLPDPGFSFVLPDEVNDALKAAGLATEGNGADLSEYLQIYTKDGNSTWDVTRYGEENSALADGTFIYRIDPAAGYETTHPLRLQFTDAAGNTYLSDDFDPAETDTLYEQYQMLIYTGELGRENIILQVEVPETESTEAQMFLCTLDVPEETSGGTLTIRYVTADDPQSVVADVYEQPEGASAADLESALSQLRADNPSLGFAVLPAGARYYVNESGIDVTENQNVAPSLLFDEIVSDETGEDASSFDSALLDRALGTLDEAGVSLDNVQHEAKFLDLVDANNGNTWLTTDKTVDVYWPYPEGTDADTTFALVHFPGLDREMENDEIDGLIQANETEYVSVENTPYGIKFSVTPEMGFSPFVLVWGDNVVIPDTNTSTDAGSDLPATGDVAMIAAASFAALGSAAVVASAITNRRNDNQ